MPVSHRLRPYRKGSVFGPGQRRPLDRNQCARFRFKLRIHARSRRLPLMHERVGEALLKRLGVDGRCDPSHDILAADAGCSARTAQRATATLRELGLLRWERRIVRDGWQAHQTSNAYQLTPEGGPNPAIPHGRQIGRGTRRIDSKPVSSGLQRSVEAQIAALPPMTPDGLARLQARKATREGRAG